MCLAEQLAETYKMAKTELVQSLSYTLTGVANYMKLLPDISEHPIVNNHPELNWHVISNLNTHNYVSKPSVETTLRPFVDKLPASTNDGEVFIPLAEVDEVVEDPDIHITEDMILAAKRLPNANIENIIEGDASGIIYGSSDDSDDLDNRSDEVHDGDGSDDEDEDDEHDDDDDDEQQEKNQMTHIENTVKNHEEENINEKEETANKQIDEDLGKGLNPDANEFTPVVAPENELLKSHSEGNVEAKTAAKIVPAPVDNSHLIGTASGYNALGKLYAV
jgi:hypothetical protein